LFVLAITGAVSLSAAVIDFESFNSGDALTTQIPGLVFSNAVVLSAADLPPEVPPRSGINVAVDLGGPIEILFNAPVMSFSGYFTYVAPLTISAFDAADVLIGTAVSAFNSNVIGGDPGSSPNELLRVDSPGIARILIQASAQGPSFAMDDIGVSSVPEPATRAMTAAGLVLIALVCRRCRSVAK
jgi:hypothetical protein